MPETTHHGFPAHAWAAATEQARHHLLAVARARGTTTYAELASAVTAIDLKPYSWAMIAFLNEICASEDERHGIMLASLVTRKDTGLPGEGYFRFAERLGRDVSDREAFWRAEVQRIYAVYGSEG